jgi:hypothetical protein
MSGTVRFYPHSRVAPSRSKLEEAAKEYLTNGAPFKADVFVIDIEEGPMVVKDFAPRAWWRRLIGLLEVNRECRAYAFLGPLPFLPEFYGNVDRNALAVEKIDGIALAHAPDRAANRDNYLRQIRDAFDRLAELGFLHLDARNNKNLLLRFDERVFFIDLAGSLWIPPGKIGHGLVRRISALYYEANVIKWETILHPGGDPRKGKKKPPRYLNGLYDLRTAWKRLRDQRDNFKA